MPEEGDRAVQVRRTEPAGRGDPPAQPRLLEDLLVHRAHDAEDDRARHALQQDHRPEHGDHNVALRRVRALHRRRVLDHQQPCPHDCRGECVRFSGGSEKAHPAEQQDLQVPVSREYTIYI